MMMQQAEDNGRINTTIVAVAIVGRPAAYRSLDISFQLTLLFPGSEHKERSIFCLPF